MTPFDRAVLLAHVAATLFMVGLIWFVQVVHYPLFGRVGAAGFPEYEAAHQSRTTFVVVPPMLVEGLSAVLLVWRPPPDAPAAWPWIGLALLAVVWLSTALLQVPRHEALARGFDGAIHRFLVRSNWLRTAAWSARAAVALGMVGRQMGA